MREPLTIKRFVETSDLGGGAARRTEETVAEVWGEVREVSAFQARRRGFDDNARIVTVRIAEPIEDAGLRSFTPGTEYVIVRADGQTVLDVLTVAKETAGRWYEMECRVRPT